MKLFDTIMRFIVMFTTILVLVPLIVKYSNVISIFAFRRSLFVVGVCSYK